MENHSASGNAQDRERAAPYRTCDFLGTARAQVWSQISGSHAGAEETPHARIYAH